MTQDNSLYENIVVRVCCQHGKPCAKGKKERQQEVEKAPSDVAAMPDPVQQPVEEAPTYENLDPIKPKVAADVPPKKSTSREKCDESDKVPTLGDEQSMDSSTTVYENKPKKRRERAARVYMGLIDWKKAERKFRGRVALYHQEDDPQKQLFIVWRKKNILSHYRVIQRSLENGMVFMAEDGSATPQEFSSLDNLVRHYKSMSR